MAFYIPHDWPHGGADRNARYPSPPAYGLACDFIVHVKRALATIGRRGAKQDTSCATDGTAGRQRGIQPPSRPF